MTGQRQQGRGGAAGGAELPRVEAGRSRPQCGLQACVAGARHPASLAFCVSLPMPFLEGLAAAGGLRQKKLPRRATARICAGRQRASSRGGSLIVCWFGWR